MILTKNKVVLKTLIEASLNKSALSEQGLVSVKFWMSMLKQALSSYNKVYVYGDSTRVAEDFNEILKIGKLIRSGITLKGDSAVSISVVILHTGVRTEIQSKHYRELMEEIATRRNVTVWHIGKWR